MDLWGQAWFLDKGVRLGRSFTALKNRWFQSIQVGADRHATRQEPLPFAQEQIEDALRDLCLSLDARDYFDLAEPIVTTIRVELPPAARQWCDLQGWLRYRVGRDPRRQAAGPRFHHSGGRWHAGAGGHHLKSDLARLLRTSPAGRHLDQDPQTIRDWNAGKIPVMFAHPASAGHGLNLQDGGNILAFFGLSWNLEERLQIIERIGPTRQAQAGHGRRHDGRICPGPRGVEARGHGHPTRSHEKESIVIENTMTATETQQANARQVGGAHCIDLGVQPWEVMQCWMTPEQLKGFLRGNAIKYLARSVRSLTSDDIMDALPTHRIHHMMAPTPLTGATLNRYLSTIRRMLNLCVEWGWMDTAPKLPAYHEADVRVRWEPPEIITKLIRA